MKKKFLAIYALTGALVASPVFTSCVDSEESASVTNIRNEKANQLKSLAALNNAKAEAELIYANAEAALKAAQTAQEQALADKYAAEAQIKELEAQMAADKYDAELAAALAQAEQNKLNAENKIAEINGEAQKYQLELEAKVAELQATLLQKKNDLINAQDGAANAEFERLSLLASKYSNALNSYTEAQNKLADYKTEKLALESELVDLNTAKEKEIAENEATIKVIDQQIAYLKEYENYSEDVKALENELTLKQAEREKANDALQALTEKYAKAQTALNDNEELKAMMEAINENELVKMYYDSYSSDYEYDDRWPDYVYEDQDGDGVPETLVDVVWRGNYINFSQYNPITNIGSEDCEIEKEGYQTYTHNDFVVEVEAQDLRRLALQIDEIVAGLNIAAMQESVDKETTGLKAVYEAKVAATATAKAAYEAAKDDATKKAAYETALGEEEAAKDYYQTALNAIEEAEKAKAKLDELYALVSTDTAELLAAVEAYNEALHTEHAALAEMEYAVADAQAVVDDFDTEIVAMNAAIYGKTETYVSLYDYLYERYVGEFNNDGNSYNWLENIASSGNLNFDVSGSGYNYTDGFNFGWSSSRNLWIDLYATYVVSTSNSSVNGAATIQDLIDDLEEAKAELLEENEDLAEITNQEQLIAKKDAEIAAQEATVAVLEVKLNAAKAALDAAMPSEE